MKVVKRDEVWLRHHSATKETHPESYFPGRPNYYYYSINRRGFGKMPSTLKNLLKLTIHENYSS